jgi:hypothetical protein
MSFESLVEEEVVVTIEMRPDSFSPFFHPGEVGMYWYQSLSVDQL